MSLHEIEKRKYGTEQAKTTPQKSSVGWSIGILTIVFYAAAIYFH